MAPNRTSSRRAAQKASEAISKSSESGAPKRKSTSKPSKDPKAKTQKTETSPSEAPKDASTQAHKGSPHQETKSSPVKEETGEQESPVDVKKDAESKPSPVKEEADEQKPLAADGDQEGENKPSPVKEETDEKRPSVDLQKEAEATFSGTKDEPPSNVIEKGIIYFFFRGKVQVDEPESLDDVARSFIVFRPLPLDSTLAGGALTDDQNCRLVMLPKKVFPTYPKQRYMAFVEKAKVDVKTIRDSFAGEEHETKTRGVRHTPAATPYAEGVYAITHSKSSTHLSYVLTIPQQVSEVQRDFGLADRGSFIVASKNPKFPGPSFAQLPKGPEYPPEIVEKMGDLRWVPIQPEFIDYPNAQIVIIGEKQEAFGSGGITESEEDKGAGGQTAADEIEKLEHVDEIRVEELHGAEAIFEDLGLTKNQFPGVESTWQ